MLLADLVATSQQVAQTSGRLEKIGLLAVLLARVEPAEIEIATAFLCGVVRQPKLGIGYAGVHAATPESAAESATLELPAVDRAFEQIAPLAGKGSADGKLRLLRELLLAATRDEQRFLTSLVIGELRQGALAGLVLEAVAQAARVPGDTVRRAAMAAGDLPRGARGALAEGAAGGCGASARACFRPCPR